MANPSQNLVLMDEATHKKNFNPISIRDLFMDKNPKLGRWIPGFVYRFLSRMLRIDFMNDPILYNHGYKKDVDFARASIEAFNVSLDVKGREHLPDTGRFIFVSNHPLGGFDGMMLISEISRSFPNLKVLANDILCQVKNMDGIFVPINKHGAQAIATSILLLPLGNRFLTKPLTSDIPLLSGPTGSGTSLIPWLKIPKMSSAT
jgi:hypothetical protein